MAKKVDDCIYSIFCPTWGDFKCKIRGIRLQSSIDCEFCSAFKARAKLEETKKCHCNECELDENE